MISYRNPIQLGRDSALEPGETRSRLLKAVNGIMGSNVVTEVMVIDNSAEAKPGGPEFTNLLACRKALGLSGKNSG